MLVDGPVVPALRRMWPSMGAAVFFMGAGAAVRLVSPLLDNRYLDPGVVCVQDGFAIALTANGNVLAAAIAELVEGCVAVPTSDYVGTSPLDDLVEALETSVDGDLAAAGAATLVGDPIRLLNPLGLPLPHLPSNLQPDNYGTEWTILIDDRQPQVRPRGKLLWLIPRTLVVGVLAGLVFVVTLAGFASKAGVVPLHAWLPRAHPEAPSHVSALMSAAMVNLGVYGICAWPPNL
ncbi:proton-conducting transporter membrane subunit, partial [Kibdelosporangium lantanae]